MFSKLPCIVNISSYKKEKLKLHGSLFGVKGGGASEQPSLEHLAVMIKINSFRLIPSKYKPKRFNCSMFQKYHREQSAP